MVKFWHKKEEEKTFSDPVIFEKVFPSRQRFVRQSVPVSSSLAHRSHTVRTPFTYRSHTVHIPFTYRSHTVRTPFAHRSHTVHTPFTHRSHTVHTPFTRRSHFAYSARLEVASDTEFTHGAGIRIECAYDDPHSGYECRGRRLVGVRVVHVSVFVDGAVVICGSGS